MIQIWSLIWQHVPTSSLCVFKASKINQEDNAQILHLGVYLVCSFGFHKVDYACAIEWQKFVIKYIIWFYGFLHCWQEHIQTFTVSNTVCFFKEKFWMDIR